MRMCEEGEAKMKSQGLLSSCSIMLALSAGLLVLPIHIHAQTCEDQIWQQDLPTLVRRSHAIAYDENRGRMVLFGGFNHVGTLLADTWESDGSAWTQASSTGPSARAWHTMAYDGYNHMTLLFGGYNSSNLGDTWQWDGVTWTQVSSSGPLPRFGHAMVYDSNRNVIVLFGGSVGGNETWEWDGSNWTLAATTGPSSRSGHAMAYDSLRHVVVLFGGQGTSRFADTWEWNGSTWSQVSTTGPSARESHTMTYDPSLATTLLFGGYNGTRLGDTWSWDGSSWQEIPASGPSPREAHAMAYDGLRLVTVMCGGFDNNYNTLSDTWSTSGAIDSDDDGIVNSCDLCPGTPSGAVVDPTTGCIPNPADFNGDGLVDTLDLDIFLYCVTGPTILYDSQQLPSGCDVSIDEDDIIAADLEGDGDVDQLDFGLFQRCTVDDNAESDPNCAD